AVILFAVLFYMSGFILMGVGSFGMFDTTNDFSMAFYHIQEALSMVIQQFMFPAIDMETALTTSRFSYLPFITYVSNISLYLLLAILTYNRRQFSYSYD